MIAIFVALIILKSGVSITKKTLNNLVDGTLPDNEIKIIKEILNSCKEISSFKNLKSRKLGPSRDIDVTLLCDENLTLKECHKICDFVEEKIKSSLPHVEITIHCEPCKKIDE